MRNHRLILALCVAGPCFSTGACGSSGNGGDSGSDAMSDTGSGMDAVGSDAPQGDSGSDGGGGDPRLFFPDETATGVVRGYELPLTSASTPVVSIPVAKGTFVAVNATSLAVSDQANVIHVFALPVTSASKEYATFSTTGVAVLAFGPGGTLYQGTIASNIRVFSPPFSNSTTSSSTVTLPTQPVTGLVFDKSGALYACDIAAGLYVLNGSTVTTTVSAPSGTHCRGVAVTATQLLVADTSGGVIVYALPLTTNSAPVATITSGLSAPEGDVIDSAGTLYVTNGNTGTVTAYAGPFTDASAPAITLTLPTANLFGIAVR